MLKAKEAAEILHLNERTVRRWLNDGRIKGVKFGQEWRVSEEELERIKKEGVKS